MKLSFLLLSLFLCTVSYSQETTIVLKTDFEGKVIEGSIENLIKEIQAGHSIRLGWGLDFDGDKKQDLEHWVDAEFLSVMNGHVYNQISSIHQQMPMPENVDLAGPGAQWYALINTKGVMQSYYDFKKPPSLEGMDGVEIPEEQKKEIIENLLKRQEDTVTTTWAVLK
jgi:hypothetical protein